MSYVLGRLVLSLEGALLVGFALFLGFGSPFRCAFSRQGDGRGVLGLLEIEGGLFIGDCTTLLGWTFLFFDKTFLLLVEWIFFVILVKQVSSCGSNEMEELIFELEVEIMSQK